MRESPKLSVIIPTFNAAKYLGQCLESIAAQGYSNLEVLVIDGGSSDDTVALARSYSIVTTIVSEPDHGQPDAVTKGVRLASGDILHWHAADDVVLPGAFARVCEAFHSSPKCDLVFSDGLAFDEQHFYWGACVRWLSFRASLFHFGRFQSDTAYWRRRASQQGLPLDLSKPLCCDEDFFLRLWRGRRSRYVETPLGGFRVRKGQLSQTLSYGDLEAARGDTRDRVCREAGIGPWERNIQKILWWPYYASFHLLAPLAMSAWRRAMRLANGKRTFGFLAEDELQTWLKELGHESNVEMSGKR